MSHELRTPLNSLLILSDQLSRNADGNLSGKQTEFAKTIHSSGNDLLMLINDILDLSKIESGTVMVDASELRLEDLKGYVERTFRHVAENKNVDFYLRMDRGLPPTMFTDAKRLQQVLKNLLSNAFKFTHHGRVSLTVEPASSGWSIDNQELNRAGTVLAFSVTDTGIGISQDKQQIIFEAFQQADGSTSRKYGGTGLGLAISRELSRLLGGEIRLASTPNKGSTFTLYLPHAYISPKSRRALGEVSPGSLDLPANARNFAPGYTPSVSAIADDLDLAEVTEFGNEAGDDRDVIKPGDRVVLIVENDFHFARVLLDATREKGFKGLVTSLGANALAMARDFKPTAITLDIFLPDMEGWRVLDRLKNDLDTRHIPVCVISTDEARERALNSGAIYFVPKPLQSKDTIDLLLTDLENYLRRPSGNILVVEPDTERRSRVVAMLSDAGTEVKGVADGPSALKALRDDRIDCVVIGPEDVELGPFELSETAASRSPISAPRPVIRFGDGELPPEVDARWKPFGEFAVIRRVQTLERLVDQTALLLHRPVSQLPPSTRQVVHDLHQSNKSLAGKKVLIVDDDMRNIFALSTVLEEHQMVISSAVNGRDAIRQLQAEPNMDIVLMDIMMPGMDGYETMREIRKIPDLRGLPIIAVTAKAMKGDREKCIEAGAWDYLSKPVDPEQMLAVLRGWLHR
jgi:CheY-like chemotaxis protein